MNRVDFKKYIESLGFEYNKKYNKYYYKKFRIELFKDNYYFCDHYDGWVVNIYYNDLTPINNYLKQELRSIKLKRILE